MSDWRRYYTYFICIANALARMSLASLGIHFAVDRKSHKILRKRKRQDKLLRKGENKQKNVRKQFN